MIKNLLRNQKGSLLLEVLVVLVIIGILLTSTSAFPFSLTRTSIDLLSRQAAQTYAAEMVSALRGIQYDSWVSLPKAPYSNPYHIEKNSTGWFLSTEEGLIDDYRVEINFSDVYRDAEGNVSTVGTVDLSTKKAEVIVYWNNVSGEESTTLVTYLSRWQEAYGILHDKSIIAQWHLDENLGNIAYDSIASNEGVINGASWFPGVSNSALSFDGNSFVEVPDNGSLDLSSPFSLEAWFYPSSVSSLSGGTIGNVVDSLNIGMNGGDPIRIIPVSGNVYLSAYSDWDDDCWVTTFQVNSDGTVVDTIIDSYEFEPNDCSIPDIEHLSGDTYLVAYRGNKSDGFLSTLSISIDGTITKNVVDTIEFDNKDSDFPDIQRVNDSVAFVAYEGQSNHGKLVSINFNVDGSIDKVVDSLEFDSSRADSPSVINIFGDIYSVAYQGSGTDGYVSTFEILQDGSITGIIDSLEFNTEECQFPDIESVFGDVYAISYAGANPPDLGAGVVTTIEISTNGVITDTVIDNMTLQTGGALYPDLIHITGDFFVNSYTDSNNNGFISSFEIASDGSLNDIVIDNFEFAPSIGYRTDLVKVSDTIIGSSYTGGNGSMIGSFSTIEFEYSGQSGVFKLGSYSIDANTEEIIAGINDVRISAIPQSGWNHTVLTYDRNLPSDQLKLYVNGSLAGSDNQTISVNINEESLLFGKNYQGLIDEITIYNYELSAFEVINLYSSY